MRVAVVGAGISGLVVAHRLQDRCRLTVFEAEDRIGGHTHTVAVEVGGREFAVDTGFIVFNRVNYPGFSGILDELGVESQPTRMSFSVHCERSGLEYNGTSLNTLFSQRRNLLRPRFHRMVLDILRFGREGKEYLREGPADDADDPTTLGEFLSTRGYSPWFVDYYAKPMGAALWSSGLGSIERFPVRSFLRFFENHKMLDVSGRPEWRVVCGGSARYVERLVRPFADRVHAGTAVRAVVRKEDGVVVRTDRDEARFDQVVIAAHSDEALSLLEDATPAEREVLGAIRYQPNEVVLHTDASLLPSRRLARAAWNYRIPREGGAELASVTYSMNILQSLDASEELCVTLNRTADIAPDRILGRYRYHHPVYTAEAVRAQARLGELQGPVGRGRTWFCGAYHGFGFHEDGVQSADAIVGGLLRETEPGRGSAGGAGKGAVRPPRDEAGDGGEA
jgi:predicted NAD/FAD-binding protein